MDNVLYPLEATNGGDLKLTQDTQAIAVSRVRLLIDTNVGERLFLPAYGTYISPFNTSNAEFEEETINSQIDIYCLMELDVNCQVRVAYDDIEEDLKYTLEFRSNPSDNGNT